LRELNTAFSNAIFRSFQNSKQDQATPLGSSFGLVMGERFEFCVTSHSSMG
jgi:hypothetical protein